jgi:bifunctional UDP-N-acetylglucosamine pyrophosphorylase/glucosamine-1-phosphate N-acetyltransferase
MKVKAQSSAPHSDLACIILAAGKGTRMRSARPKVMHAIAHKPMLLHVIDTARALKSEKIVMITSADMEEVRSNVKRHYKDEIISAIQQEQHGTGDAVKAAKAALKDYNGTVLILYGDTPLIQPETLTHMVEALKDSKVAVAVLGMEVSTPNDYGRLVVDAKGNLERIVEVRDATAKEKAITLCNSGVMAVRGNLLFPLLAKITNKNAKGEYYLTDLVAHANKANHRCVVVSADPAELMGINSRAELASAEASIQKRLRKQAIENGVTLIDPASVYFASDTKLGHDVIIHPHVVFGPGVEVGDNVEIRSFSHIEGAKIRSSAVIGPFARLRPGAVIGEHAHVGNFVEIKQATLERNTKVNHLSYIGDAHVGSATNIGAGTITANYDGYDKHRTVIGSGVSIGSDTVLVAPVTIGDGAMIGAGSVITEDVEADALAITRSPQTQKLQWAKKFRSQKKH